MTPPQLSTRVRRLNALSYALVVADLVAIAVWTWDFFGPVIFDSLAVYFAYGVVIVLLGCLGVVVLLLGVRQGAHRRRPSMICLYVSSSLLLLPLFGYALFLLAGFGMAAVQA